MELRRDAFLAAARFALAAREAAVEHGGVATVGPVKVSPGVPTIINGRREVVLDQRAFAPEQLAAMLADAHAAAERIGGEEGVEAVWREIWRIDPVPLHPELVELAAQACEETTGTAHRLPSGALHDCAEVARRAPATMLFAASIDGVSTTRRRRTPAEDDLRAGLTAYARLVELTMAWLTADAAEDRPAAVPAGRSARPTRLEALPGVPAPPVRA